VRPADLEALREKTRAGIRIRWEADVRSERRDILVCCGGGCVSSGSAAVRDALRERIAAAGLAESHRVVEVGCMGLCGLGPLVVIRPEGTLYCQVEPEDATRIVSEHFLEGRVVEDLLVEIDRDGTRARTMDEVPFFSRQTRIASRNMGLVDPGSIAEYIARDGYAGLARVLSGMRPADVVAELKRSGLRGRGGGGFSTGLKWEFTQRAEGSRKFVVCNADEGDPGAFMDRSLLEGDPHSIIEGMAIAAYAVGARQGFVYVRAEYPLAIERLTAAVAAARQRALLGRAIMGSAFEFDIEIRIGAGAFVCGEETALIASIEGKRGTPRPRPPFPAERGLWGCPTLVNNVETYANVGPILLDGGEAFAAVGTEKSTGTKVFALTGDIRLTGLIEVPMGTPLGEIIHDIGGGIREGKAFKAAQIGGPSGGCIPRAHLNVPVDYESLKDLDAIMGSGGLVVMDEHTCMVNLTRFFLEFLVDESCGKCVPCRVGTARMLEILVRITEGRGEVGDIERLEALGRMMKEASLCGLGQTAPNSLLSTLRFFREEYEAHIARKVCPAGVCPDLVLAPCEHECPAHVDVPGYVALIGERRFDEALDLHRDRHPFPGVCGRVCTHPCEAVCRRQDTDEAIAIRPLKRFIADRERGSVEVAATPAPTAAKAAVAIIGAGPAGLTAAYLLAPLGYRTTVFETRREPGGALCSIPEYRLPKAIIREEVARIVQRGVEIRTSTPIGNGLTLDGLFAQEYKAILVATGAHVAHRLGVPGEGLAGVVEGLSFLWRVGTLDAVDVKDRKVVVIGGGNVAIDAARSATRLGAKEVNVIYRRRRDEMPADQSEIAEGKREGVVFHHLLAPTEVIGTDRVEGLRCARMRLATFDESGRRRPVATEDTWTIAADVVVVAVGQTPGLVFAESERIAADRRGLLVVDPETSMTDRDGVFAAGDVTTGAATVVEAIAGGQQAAIGMDRYLGGAGILWPERRDVIRTTYDEEAYAEPHTRAVPGRLSAEARRNSFAEVEGCLTAEAAVEEARRCLHCDRRD